MVKITELLDTQNVTFKKTQKGPDVKYTWDVQGRTFEAVMGEDFDDASRETIEDFYGIADVPSSMPELFPLYNFVFWDEEQSSAVSGKGNAAQVFTGAAAILLDFITTYSEGSFAFGFSAKEPSRMRLYDTFAKALSRKLNLPYSTGLVPPDDEDKLYVFWVTKKGDTVMTESRNIKRVSLIKERTSKIFERAKILALRKYPKTDERYYSHALAIAKRMQEDLLDAALSDVAVEPEKVDSASELNDTAKEQGEESKQATVEEPWGAESTRIEKQKVKESLASDEPPNYNPEFSGSYDDFVGEGSEQPDISQDEEDSFKNRVISDEDWERNEAEWDAAHPEGIFSEATGKTSPSTGDFFEWKGNSTLRKATAWAIIDDFVFEYTFNLLEDGYGTWPSRWLGVKKMGVKSLLKLTIDQLNNYEHDHPRINPDTLEMNQSRYDKVIKVTKDVLKDYFTKFGKKHFQYLVTSARDLKKIAFLEQLCKTSIAGLTKDEEVSHQLTQDANTPNFKYYAFKNSSGPKLAEDIEEKRIEEKIPVAKKVDVAGLASSIFNQQQMQYINSASGMAKAGKVRSVTEIEKYLGKAPMSKSILKDIIFEKKYQTSGDLRLCENVFTESDAPGEDPRTQLNKDENAYLDKAQELIDSKKAKSAEDIVTTLGPGTLGPDFLNQYFFSDELQPVAMSEAAELGSGDVLDFAGGKVKIADYSKDPPPKTYSRSSLSADPDQRAQAAMRKQIESLKEDKKFPDSEQGAIQALLDMADPQEIKSTNIARAKPDPQVDGVWEIFFKKPIAGGDTKAIVYLAGYREPSGEIRSENDFETGQGLHEAFGPMGGPQIGSAPRPESPSDSVTWPKEIRTDEYDWPDGKPEDDDEGDESPIFDLDEDEGSAPAPSGAVTSDAFDAAPFDACHNWKKDARAQGLTENQLEASIENEVQDLYSAGNSMPEIYSFIKKSYRLGSRETIDAIERALQFVFEDDYDSRYELEGLEESAQERGEIFPCTLCGEDVDLKDKEAYANEMCPNCYADAAGEAEAMGWHVDDMSPPGLKKGGRASFDDNDVPIISSVKMWNEKKSFKEARIGSVIDKILDKAPVALKEPLRFAGVVVRDDKTPFRNKREIYNTIYSRLNQYGKEHPESKIRYDANEDKMYGLTPEQVRAITTIVDADNKAWDQALAKGQKLDSKQIVQLYYSLLQQGQVQTNKA